ncbi:hypothetical protein BJV74DRAFT_794126 [Russula compacta]|nr:hypothetical protein BJV74DRAFT_794126 [Russula compacta]
MAELSNNPFIDHTASVASRFPNINAVSSPPPGPSTLQYSAGWPQQQQQQQQQQQPSYQSSGFVGTSPTGYTQQYSQQPQWPQQQQQQQQQPQYQPQLQQSPYSPTSFQSPSPYGQQLLGQVNSLATGYPQTQMQAQYTGYPTQQPQQASYSYQQPQQTGYGYPQHQQQQQLLAQFDPYANLGQFSPTGSGAATVTSSVPITNGAAIGSQPPALGVQHPRSFIHTHKAELEAWDAPTWRQAQSAFEALKAAWESRKRTAEAQVRALGGTVGAPPSSNAGFFGGAGMGAYGMYGGGGYQTPQALEIDRLNALIKESDTNIDTIAAAALQMSEVFAGYRHSGDMASKRRVRESCNAAVTGLPEYPPSTL